MFSKKISEKLEYRFSSTRKSGKMILFALNTIENREAGHDSFPK
jgi:hypothetical protein